MKNFRNRLSALFGAAAFILAAATAARADNAASTCAATAVNDVLATCYTVTPMEGVPVVDGIEEALWASAPSKALGAGTVKFIRQTDVLYLLVTVDDATESQNDFLDLYFDPLHDHAATTDDVMLHIPRPTGTVQPLQKTTSAGGTVTWVPGAGVLGTSNAAALWRVEIMITAAELGAPFLRSVYGFGAFASNSAGLDPTWPANFNVAAPATTWANIKSRLPIQYALSLDFSGSMVALDGIAVSRWKRAHRAGELFGAVASLFREPAYFLDQIGSSRYAWSCSDDNSTGDATAVFSAMIGIPNPGTNLFPPGSDVDPPGNNCTPIKRGLKFALEDQLGFGTPAAAESVERIIVLLSDGFHNQPPADLSFATDPTPHFSLDERNYAKVRTVALGPDGSAGTDLLAAIAADFLGGAPTVEGKYIQLAAAGNLVDAYLETLQPALHTNRIFPVGGQFTVDRVEKLAFIATWDPPAGAGALTVTRDGAPVTPDATIAPNGAVGYAAVVFNNPDPHSNWQVTSATAITQLFGVVDLRLFADFPTEQKVYHPGETILLQARLREMDHPVTGAEVKVEIAKPGEGLGNFLATVQEDCKASDPFLPRPGRDVNLSDRTIAPAASGSVTGAAAGHPGTQAADPLAGRYAVAGPLLGKCRQDGLERDTLPGVPMHDDGTHGDMVSGDGIYTLAFDSTSLEGSYNFRFFARGLSPDSVAFTRMGLYSHYVSIAPDDGSTPSSFVPGAVSGAWQQGVAYVLPKDKFSNHLGPGFASSFVVSVRGGQALGKVADAGRGVYAQVVRYPAGGKPPEVVFEIPDLGFQETAGSDGTGQEPPTRECPRWIYWLLILLALLVLLLLILLILCRGRKP